MRMKRDSKIYLLGFVLALWASALSAQTHWTANTSGYSSYMTVWFSLQEGDTPVDYSGYEIAAFIDDECRGIGTTVSGGGHTVGKLLVYGDATANGKKIAFKSYNKSTGEEKSIYGVNIVYANDGQQGLPSTPTAFDLANNVILGDVDGDGEISIFDAVAIVEYYLTDDYPGFVVAAADFNGDGEIDIFDAVAIVDYYLYQ